MLFFFNYRVHIYAFILLFLFCFLIAVVQMFKFGLTCFKARKAKIFFKYWEIYLVPCGYRVSGACIINKGFRVSDIRSCVCVFYHEIRGQQAPIHETRISSPIFKQKVAIVFVFSALLLKRLLYKCIDKYPVILKSMRIGSSLFQKGTQCTVCSC